MMKSANKPALCVVSNLPVNMKRKMIFEAFQGGQFVTVEWVKKDGTIGKMNCRYGVTKHLKNTGKVCKNGTTNTVAHLKQYLTVYKTNKGYRNLDMETVLTLKYKGNVIHFSG